MNMRGLGAAQPWWPYRRKVEQALLGLKGLFAANPEHLVRPARLRRVAAVAAFLGADAGELLGLPLRAALVDRRLVGRLGLGWLGGRLALWHDASEDSAVRGQCEGSVTGCEDSVTTGCVVLPRARRLNVKQNSLNVSLLLLAILIVVLLLVLTVTTISLP